MKAGVALKHTATENAFFMILYTRKSIVYHQIISLLTYVKCILDKKGKKRNRYPTSTRKFLWKINLTKKNVVLVWSYRAIEPSLDLLQNITLMKNLELNLFQNISLMKKLEFFKDMSK